MKKRKLINILSLIGLFLFLGSITYVILRPAPAEKDSMEETTSSYSATPQASQPLAASKQAQVEEIMSVGGTFRGTSHEGRGEVSVTTKAGKSTIHLADNFYVTPGPDLYVAFGNDEKVDKNALFAVLKANEGAADYDVPANIDASRYTQVIIYCKAYGYEFSVASLR